jgi:hypothetical protein
MGFIRGVAVKDGVEIAVKYEAPNDAAGHQAIGYLKPSGATYVNPMFAWAKQAGAADEGIRAAHRGVDGQGTEYVSDQRWVYDPQEAVDLAKQFPDRWVRVEA